MLDRAVALKLLPPEVTHSPERLARFSREAKLLASLNHPNIATIHGLEDDGAGLSFLVLEWVEGETLAARLRPGALPWRAALEVCGEIARGLAAAHEGAVIHRDLKPGNVMLTPQGRVKVLDFGLARRGLAPERRGARLVTLQGVAGMGKTRLAIRYGWRSLEEWPGGVWFCDLTEARSHDGIAAAVAGPLDVPLGKDPVTQLGHAIAGRGRCLLILDNFEQVVEHAAETVAPWLARATEARFVVTSRERLNLAEEEVAEVEPLGSEPGVELFVERARRQRPQFELEEAEAVREVVRLVEGIPLAIELAAARVRLMTPAQIVTRMRERFRLLAGSDSGRHATLQVAIDGSWELLAPWEQGAFAQCAVFEGGFTLEAAEAVLDLTAWKEAPWIPDVVRSLVD